MSEAGSTTRIAELLRRGPMAPPRSRARPLRRLARNGMLRALRPYSAYQHQLDEAVVEAIEAVRCEGERREAGLVQRLRELQDLLDRRGAQIDGMQRLADDLVNAVRGLSGTQTVGLHQQVALLAREAELWHGIPYVAGNP